MGKVARTDKVLAEIFEHAKECLPKESCGLLVKNSKDILVYVPSENLENSTEGFILAPEAVIRAEDLGEVVYIVHSHGDSTVLASDEDLIGIEKSNVPWIIVNTFKDIKIYYPQNTVQFEGRPFKYGVYDCYSLARDYYASLGIYLPDFIRFSENWWQDYCENPRELYTVLGFQEVSKSNIKTGDFLVMSLTSKVPNHFGIYLGNSKILHHPVNRLSIIEDIEGLYYNSIVLALRKEELQ